MLALWVYIGLPDLYSYIIIVFTLSTIVLCRKSPIAVNTVDMMVMLFIVYQIISFLFSNYRVEIYYYGVKAQVMPMAFYFIGRNTFFRKDNKFLDNMKYPMMFAFVVGLILYFWQPSWYIAKKTMDLAQTASTHRYYEVTRLSSFWSWSYAMGYGSLYFIMYFSKDILVKKPQKIAYVYIVTAILVLFFAQQRVSITFFVLFIVIISFFGNVDRKKIVRLWTYVCIVFLLILIWMLKYADADFVDYVLSRSVQSDENIVNQRFEMFGSFWNVSFLGEGLGKYGHAALGYNKLSITDCEYIRLMAELGIMGCAIFFIIYLKSIFRAFIYRKALLFEFCIISFFLASMIGATPLENQSMQPFLFWFCMGRINSPILIKK